MAQISESAYAEIDEVCGIIARDVVALRASAAIRDRAAVLALRTRIQQDVVCLEGVVDTFDHATGLWGREGVR